jgi:limonene 1,2-monooxygenase
MPRFQQANDNREASLRWAADNRPRFIGEAQKAVGARVAQHVAEKGSENIRPEILAAMGLDKKPEAAE